MTITWDGILFSKLDQPYVLAAPAPAQRRRTVHGRTFGWKVVCRFISTAVERAAHAVAKAEAAAIELAFEMAKMLGETREKAARRVRAAAFCRAELKAFGSRDCAAQVPA